MTTENVKNAAPKILEIIKASSRILLHCHPSPDPDSMGSALAMKFALEQLGKKATVFQGDDMVPDRFKHFPGALEIVPKNFFQLDLTGPTDGGPFDLILVQDSSITRVSRLGTVVLPANMKCVTIDHHMTNIALNDGTNIVDTAYPATAMLLYDLFTLWDIRITPEIAANLFIGIYTDTGGFKYSRVGADVIVAAGRLAEIYPDFSPLIMKMENSATRAELAFEGVAFSNIDTALGGNVAFASISNADMVSHGITSEDTNAALVANVLKSVVGWNIGVCLTEYEKGKVKVNFRTRDENIYDVSVIAGLLGGGGHKAAAAAVIPDTTIPDAKKKVIEMIRQAIPALASAV